MILKKHKGVLVMLDKLALIILIIGGLNWGSIGLFGFGGQGAIVSRIIFVLVALAAVWCISLLFRDNSVANAEE